MCEWKDMIGDIITDVSSANADFKRPPDDVLIFNLRKSFDSLAYDLKLYTQTLIYPAQCGVGESPFIPDPEHHNPEIVSVKLNGVSIGFELEDDVVYFEAPLCDDKSGVIIKYKYSIKTDKCTAPDKVCYEPYRSMVVKKASYALLSNPHMDWYSPVEARNRKADYDSMVLDRRKARTRTKNTAMNKRAGDQWWAI